MGILHYGMNIQYKGTLLRGIVALIMVNMLIQSAFILSKYSTRIIFKHKRSFLRLTLGRPVQYNDTSQSYG